MFHKYRVNINIIRRKCICYVKFSICETFESSRKGNSSVNWNSNIYPNVAKQILLETTSTDRKYRKHIGICLEIFRIIQHCQKKVERSNRRTQGKRNCKIEEYIYIYFANKSWIYSHRETQFSNFVNFLKNLWFFVPICFLSFSYIL